MNIHKAESFKEFEEKFKFLFDNAADPIFILDNKGRFIQINKKVKEILGYREKDLIGKKFIEMNILTKKSKLIALKNFIKRMAGFEIKLYEIEIIKKNGDIVIGEINASAIKENGKTIGDMVICRDVTEKRKTEEQIKESEKKYKILYESSNDAIMTLEPPSWKFTSGNPATVNMFNTKDEKEFTSLGPWELSPEKQPNGQLSSEKAKKMIEKAMKKGSNFFEWTHKRYKGEDFPATVLLSRIELKGRKLLQATVRDISKEKKTQEEIEKSEKKFKDIITTIPDWVWELNERGQYTFVGQQIKKILGYKSEEILGKTPFDLMPKDEIKKIAKVFEKTVKNKKSFSNLENWNVHKNGTKVLLETSGVPILDKKGNLIGYRGIDRDITERKIAEQKIKESEEKYRALISNIPAIVMNVDQNGKIMFINYTLPGFTIEKTIGKTIYDFIPPEYHDKAKETIKQVFKTGKASIYEIIGAGPKGDMKYYSTVVGPIEQGKKVVSVVLISSDITERKKAEEELKISEARYRSYIEATKQLGWTTDAKGLVIEDIPTWRAYTGQSFEQIKNWGWVKAVHPDDAKHTAEVWEKAIKTKSTYETEYRVRGKDGKYKWFLARGVPVLKENGSIREWVGTCIDITELKKAQEELKESEEKYNIFFNNASDAITVISPDTRKFIDANNSAEKLTGYSKKELLSMTFDFIHPKDKIEEIVASIRKTLETGSIAFLETDVLTKDNKIVPVILSGSKIKVGNKMFLMGIFKDITERKKTEEELRNTKNYLDNLLNYANAPIIVWDNEKRITLFNNAFEAFTGHKKEFMLGRNMDILFPPLQKEKILHIIEDATKGDKWKSIEIPILCNDKKTKFALWNSTNITDKEGKTVATIAQGQDITERKYVEEELRKMKDVLQSKVEELERFNRLAVGRELKMVELKNRIKELEKSNKT